MAATPIGEERPVHGFGGGTPRVRAGPLTRREALEAGLAGCVALSTYDWTSALDPALAHPPRCGRLDDIEHVVILVQENRSFDSYFGSLHGVRGFGDRHPKRLSDGSGRSVFAQPGYDRPGYGGHLYPFHFDTGRGGECVGDPTHDWGPQHLSWNGGRMDGFVKQHLAADGPQTGPDTMGYYTRADLPFYYALADAFTICDRYHCSVLGPTTPNQLYVASATLDPDGRAGGPLISNPSAGGPQLGWTTMPEQLESRGISWKVYSSPDNKLPEPSLVSNSPFQLFRRYYEDPQLASKGLEPSFPQDFQADVAAGALPQVSWLYAPGDLESGHPPAPVTYDEYTASMVVGTLTAKRSVWEKTVLFITWDENGGFFDHVPPPTPPLETPGEHLGGASPPAAADGIRGPIGLGFRVPLLVVSPFSRGGFVCSHVFDHTSLLRFVETRFGAEVPNLSAWRRAVTGDLTQALNLAAPNAGVPRLPQPSLTDPRVVRSGCPTSPLDEAHGPALEPYPVPPNSIPRQERGRPRRPSGLACHEPLAGTDRNRRRSVDRNIRR